MPTSSGCSPRLKTTERSTSPGFASVCALAAIARMPKSSTAVPMNSLMALPMRVPYRRPRAEDAQLRRRVVRLAPVRQVGQPDQHRADERADHLGGDVARDLRPRKTADGGERDRDGGIEVRATDAPDGVDADGDGDAPAGGDHDPAAVLSLRALEHDVGDDAVAEQDENHGAERLGQQRLHGRRVYGTLGHLGLC